MLNNWLLPAIHPTLCRDFTDCDKAFKSLKTALASEPILQLPNLNEPFVVRTDASGHAVGAMLAQKNNQKLHPIAYYSWKLLESEWNYSTTDREGLAVITAHLCGEVP